MFNFFNKNKRVYLDYGASTPISEKSKEALISSLSNFGNPSSIHKEGVIAGLLLDKARSICAKVINSHAYEIFFMGTGTESCNIAILGTYFAFTKNWKLETENCVPHMIVSSIEHPAVLEPISKLEKEGKIRVTYLPVYDDGIVKLKDVREAICDETILVSVMYANNEIGTIQPVKEIGRFIENWKKENGRTHTSYPYFHIDACQASNYLNLDVVRLRAHLMTLNSSKVYGPKGVALLYKREGIKVDPIILGGGQERVLRSGTEDVPSIYAFAIALSESNEMKEKESMRLRTLRDYAVLEMKKNIKDVVFYGAFDKYISELKTKNLKLETILRLPNNINCRIPNISSEEMILRLDAKGIALSHKSACASRETDGSYVIEAIGGSRKEALENVRITLGRYTTIEDVDKLVKCMKEVAEKFIK